MFAKAKPYLMQVALILGVLVALKYLVPAEYKAKIL